MISGLKISKVIRFFKVDGKALRIRNTLVLEDLENHECKIQKRMLRLKDTMDIEAKFKIALSFGSYNVQWGRDLGEGKANLFTLNQ